MRISLLFSILFFSSCLIGDEIVEMNIYSFYWGNIKVHPLRPYKLLEICEKQDEGIPVRGGYKYKVCIKNKETLSQIDRIMGKMGFQDWKEAEYPRESKAISTTHAIVILKTGSGKKWSFCLTEPWEKNESAIYWFNTPVRAVPEKLVVLTILNLPNKEFKPLVRFVQKKDSLNDYEYMLDSKGNKVLKTENYTVDSIKVYISKEDTDFSKNNLSEFDSITFVNPHFCLKEKEKLLPDSEYINTVNNVRANYIFEVSKSFEKFYFKADAKSFLSDIELIGDKNYVINPRLLDFFESMLPINKCSRGMPINILEYAIIHSE